MAFDQDTWTVSIDAPRLDDFEVYFNTAEQAEEFVEFMVQLAQRGQFKLWFSDEEGNSDLRWG